MDFAEIREALWALFASLIVPVLLTLVLLVRACDECLLLDKDFTYLLPRPSRFFLLSLLGCEADLALDFDFFLDLPLLDEHLACLTTFCVDE